MIIIKPDLVIKWANSNLVLHRVREHLCVCVPLCSRLSIRLYISEYTCDWAGEFECAHALNVCVCVFGESAAEERHIYRAVWLGMETAIIFLLGKKQKRKNTNIPPSILFLLLILYLALPLSLSPSLSVSLTKEPFPPKWGHVRKVCKWNHCSWIRMGHHIP